MFKNNKRYKIRKAMTRKQQMMDDTIFLKTLYDDISDENSFGFLENHLNKLKQVSVLEKDQEFYQAIIKDLEHYFYVLKAPKLLEIKNRISEYYMSD